MTEPKDDVDDFPEQYSDATRVALSSAVDALIEGLRRHASYVSGLRGGTSEMRGLFNAHAEVERLLDAWNERVFDHTGTFPVSLLGREDDDELESEVDGGEDQLNNGAPVSVVSRWDLSIVDAKALLAAGRQAHKRLQPHENDEDAAAAVPDVGQALYALMHEAGEPWFQLPGVAVVRGARAYIQPDELAMTPEDDDFDAPIVEPTGRRLYGESWA